MCIRDSNTAPSTRLIYIRAVAPSTATTTLSFTLGYNLNRMLQSIHFNVFYRSSSSSFGVFFYTTSATIELLNYVELRARSCVCFMENPIAYMVSYGQSSSVSTYKGITNLRTDFQSVNSKEFLRSKTV